MGKQAKKSGALRPAERWAIGVTAIVLALTLGLHLGTAGRVPELRVETETPTATAALEPSAGAAAETTGTDDRIDLNRATAEELQALRGIGPALAERIVAYREEHGPFAKVEELTLVNGISPALLEKNAERLYIGEAEP